MLRVDALDFVRGVCALAVAIYHVLGWLRVAHLHALGTYGVYAFFVISGASLALGYSRRLGGSLALQKFLLARYARLLPLFALVVFYNIAMQGRAKPSALEHVAEQAGIALLNLSFLFGLANPGATSLVTGGWSLGIEFVFYLVFPLLMAVLAVPRWRIWVLLGSLLAQRAFVEQTLGAPGIDSLADGWVAYTQPLAFIAYFAWGCAIGLWRLERSETPSSRASFAWACASLLLLALVFGVPNASDVAALVGVRGTWLCCATIACVACATRVSLKGFAQRTARYFGDISYGVYLLHPVVYASVHTVVGKRELAAHPLAWTTLIVVAATLGALVAKRFIEDPVMNAARARIARLGLR